MSLDIHGRPTSKACPGCTAVLARTARVCPTCDHFFVGKHWAANQRKKGLSEVPVKPEPRTAELVKRVKPAALPVAVIDEPTPRLAIAPAEHDGFDCEALPDGRLRIMLPAGWTYLTARQRQIIAIELRIA